MLAMTGRWVAGLAVAVLAATCVRADEENVPLDKLPKAVVEAVKKMFPDAQLVSASTEDENGKKVFEVAIKNKGQTIEVTLTPEGKLVSVEKEITVKDLPRPVTTSLDAKYAKAVIKKVEEITKDGKLTYEVLLVTADKKMLEVVFDPQGKVVQEEVKGKKDKD